MSDDRILGKKIGEKVLPCKPQVSVIIPAYNCVEFIGATLDSVFAQTFKDYEIVLVNDGSADTEELEKVLENYFDRITYITQKNRGTAAARNTAIENASGEFLAFLDSDDIWLPEYLDTQIEAITQKNCDMIYADALLFGDLINKTETFMMQCPSNGRVTTESLISGKCNIPNSGTVVRRQKVLEAGMLDEDLPRIGVEDFDLWFRLARIGAKIEYQKKVLLKYRVSRMSLSGDSLQRAERAVTVLKLLETKYQLGDAEKEKLESQLKLAVAALQIEKGKYNLIWENFALAREHLLKGNVYYRKSKYSALALLLAVIPKIILKLFIKARPAEVTFMSDSVFELEKFSVASETNSEIGAKIANETPRKEDSLTSQSAWILFAKVVGFGLNILLPLLVVRYLTQHQVGVYRQIFLVVANAVSILPLGFSMSAYYFLNREPEKRSYTIFNILLFNFVMGGLAFLTLLFFPQLLGNLFQNQEITRLAPLVGIVIWLWIFSNFLEIVALANQEARLATFFIILAQFTKMLLMVGAVVAFATIEAFIYAAIVQAVLQTFVLLVYLNRRFLNFWKSFDWQFFREQIIYALPFGFAALLYTSQTDIHNYFVSHSFSPAEFAIYSQGCFQLPLIAILYESISSVVIPRMSQLQAQGKKREMLLMSVNAMQKLALAYFPLFFFLMIVTEEFITTLFTKDYAASVSIFRINLLLLPFFCLMIDPIGRAFPEVGKFLLKLRIVLFVVLIAALSFGVRHFDLRGIISIVVVAIIIENIASLTKALRILEVKREDIYLLKNVGKTAIAAAASGVFLLVFYLLAKSFLLELCINFSRNALAIVKFEKGADFLGGSLFLGICFIIYASIYLFFADRLGAIESRDKEKLIKLFRKITRRRGGMEIQGKDFGLES